jgi:hypothetical protein
MNKNSYWKSNCTSSTILFQMGGGINSFVWINFSFT